MRATRNEEGGLAFIGGARQGSCPMNEATLFMMGVAGLALWAAIVAVQDMMAAWKRKRLRVRR
ncbi:hypothetical protein AC628_30850 [Bradyrhizobium sp. NAS96.2]|nr:hypothetical protein AC628_30850 [Bradyrhizobium sp. NAS96.2]